jgi:hypothetical protein
VSWTAGQLGSLFELECKAAAAAEAAAAAAASSSVTHHLCMLFSMHQINVVDFEIGFFNSANVKTLLFFEKFFNLVKRIRDSIFFVEIARF